jgi:DNA-binding beta-propeller fold protein YncE
MRDADIEPRRHDDTKGRNPEALVPLVPLWLALLALALTGCKPRADEPATTPLHSSIFSHVEIIGSRGTGAGQFNKPRSLICDTNDNLYVVDMTGRVQKFSPEGKFLLSWQMPQTELGKPKGMACDREGNIVVLEPHYQRVNHFTPEGKLIAQWGVKGTNAGELTLPRSIAVDTKNNVIVSEYTLVDRVQKFSARGGRCFGAWGTPGQAPGEFNRAEGVGTDSADQIYVADSCNHRIQIFSGEGKLLRAHGHAGTATGEMSYPYDVTVDKQGRHYVCEFGNSRIQVFDAKDQPLEIIGKAGGEPGQFANPWSLTLDSKGSLYVADSQNHRVQKLVRKK